MCVVVVCGGVVCVCGGGGRQAGRGRAAGCQAGWFARALCGQGVGGWVGAVAELGAGVGWQ